MNSTMSLCRVQASYDYIGSYRLTNGIMLFMLPGSRLNSATETQPRRSLAGGNSEESRRK